ncbi:MAG: tetratricopeptide repeat protein [Kiritimatiellae bacterium]|nr:tetratricopeptide repeat protein [Kiritimatiellia bacterium]
MKNFFKKISGISVRYLFIGVGIVAFLSFLPTVSSTIGIGSSAWFTAETLGVFPKVPAHHPVAQTIYGLLKYLPAGTVLFGMRLLSAVIMAIVAALVFRFARSVILYEVFESDAGRASAALPGDDWLVSTVNSNDPHAQFHHEWDNRVASIAAAIAVFLFITSVPVRLVATSQQPQSVTMLLLLLILNGLIDFHWLEDRTFGMFALFLLGVALFENPLFWVLAPIFIFWIFRIQLSSDGLSESVFIGTIMVLLLGFALGGGIFCLQTEWTRGTEHVSFFQAFVELKDYYLQEILLTVPHRFWVLGGAAVLLPFLLSLRGLWQFQADIRRISPAFWQWNLLFLAVAGLIACNLLHIGPTPWSIARQAYYLPVISSFMIAMATSSYAAFALLQFVVMRREKESHVTISPYETAVFCYPQVLVVLALIGIGVFAWIRGWNEGDVRQTDFLDKTAEWFVEHADKARHALCDSELFPHIHVKAHLAGKQLKLHQASFQTQYKKTKDPVPFRLALPSELRKRTPERAIESWLRTRPAQVDGLIVQSQPLLWQQNGYRALPSGLFYRGSIPSVPVDVDALLAENRACWEMLKEVLPEKAPAYPIAARFYNYLRVHAGSVANNLGALVLNTNPPVAAEAFKAAQTFNVNHIPACLNDYVLKTLHPELGSAAEEEEKLVAMAAKDPELPTKLRDIAYQTGQFAVIEPDRFLPTLYKSWTVSKNWSPELQKLLNAWVSLAHPQPRGDRNLGWIRGIKRRAESEAQLADKKEKKMSHLVANALHLYLDGDLIQSKQLLYMAIEEDRTDLFAWGLLAEILIARGEYREIEISVLPAMKVSDEVNKLEKPSLLTSMVSGIFELLKKEPDFTKARGHFLTVLDHDPTLFDPASYLLRTDIALGNPTFADEDAKRILKAQPEHPLAFAVLGSLALAKNDLEKAETHLNHSLELLETGTTQNDLAELFRRKKAWKEADEHIRRAIRIEPMQPNFWHALAEILFESGHPEEASEVIDYTLFMNGKDPRYLLTKATILLSADKKEQADKILQMLIAGLPEQHPVRKKAEALQAKK